MHLLVLQTVNGYYNLFFPRKGRRCVSIFILSTNQDFFIIYYVQHFEIEESTLREGIPGCGSYNWSCSCIFYYEGNEKFGKTD